MIPRLPFTALLLAATTLAACSGGSDAPPPPPESTENVTVIDETPVENIVEPEPTPSPTPSPTPIVEDDMTTEEQVLDDADAVGMTARLPRPEAEETTPAE